MNIQRTITPVFVDFIPDHVEQGKLYISEAYHTAIHKCCCGCGEEVVTPLSPVDWQLTKLKNGVSLTPSIGNWKYRCKSHYIIRDNKIIWARKFTPEQISAVLKRDDIDKKRYIVNKNKVQPTSIQVTDSALSKIWKFIKSLFNGKNGL